MMEQENRPTLVGAKAVDVIHEQSSNIVMRVYLRGVAHRWEPLRSDLRLHIGEC